MIIDAGTASQQMGTRMINDAEARRNNGKTDGNGLLLKLWSVKSLCGLWLNIIAKDDTEGHGLLTTLRQRRNKWATGVETTIKTMFDRS